MKHSKILSTWTLILLALFLSGPKSANTQSKPSPEKHETPANVSVENTSQNNQAALSAALIETLRAETHQEEAAAIYTRAQNGSLISPSHVQEGLLFVGIVYSTLALLQWVAIYRQGNIANKTLIETQKAAVAAKDAAEASQASARAADASLHVYRPFLVIESVKMAPTLTVSTIPTVFGINVRNSGIGPADMLRVHMKAEVFLGMARMNQRQNTTLLTGGCRSILSSLRAKKGGCLANMFRFGSM